MTMKSDENIMVNGEALPIPRVSCPFCGKVHTDVLMAIIRHKVPYRIEGNAIYLTFYDCTQCGNRKVLQIDDDYSYVLFRKIERLAGQVIAIKKRGGSAMPKQKAKFEQMQSDLSRCRRTLNSKYYGASLFDKETGKKFIIT